jgi:hypothetical protein
VIPLHGAITPRGSMLSMLFGKFPWRWLPLQRIRCSFGIERCNLPGGIFGNMRKSV